MAVTFRNFDRCWHVTWTTYATWLPGDDRGFVSPKFHRPVAKQRNNTIGTPFDSMEPELADLARSKVVGQSVFLGQAQAFVVQSQLRETAQYRNWMIVSGAIMANHIHLLVGVPGDPDPATLLGNFKSYASRALNRKYGKPASGTWWTEQGSKRKMTDASHFENVRGYIHSQENPLVIWDVDWDENADVE